MRIVLLSAATSVHTQRWANAYAARGHEVHLIGQHPSSIGYHDDVTMHDLPHAVGLGYLLNGPRLARLLRELKPDVVNAHYATGYGTLARSVRGVPLVLNVWGSDVFDFPEKSVLHKWWVRRNLVAATWVVSTSEAMADRTRQLVPGPGRLTVVPFGVDTRIYAPFLRKDDGPTLVIGTVKSLAPVYGIDVLIKAFARLVEHSPGAALRLRIVGDGPSRRELEELAVDQGVGRLVEFTGAVPHSQVLAELQRMDVFCALSRQESFGVAVIEASACALPVIVSDAGGLPEVVKDGVTGMVVPRNDHEAAAKAMAQLVASSDLRRQWGTAGRVHVQANYEWAQSVDRMESVLREAIKTYRRA
ncbi:MAG: glycosyltransferase [Flavobacteriales bacterium]|nr:MAG: glycosyltransferase [Flavobacteriales bacterium]